VVIVVACAIGRCFTLLTERFGVQDDPRRRSELPRPLVVQTASRFASIVGVERRVLTVRKIAAPGTHRSLALGLFDDLVIALVALRLQRPAVVALELPRPLPVASRLCALHAFVLPELEKPEHRARDAGA
jgi:hypothetical protein